MKRMRLLSLLVCVLSTLTFSSDFTLEELNELKSLGLVSEQDYRDLLMELENKGLAEKTIYRLEINGKEVTKEYEVIGDKGRQYFELEKFFQGIGFTNYYPKKDEITFYLGDGLEEVRIVYSKNKVYMEGKALDIEGDYQKVIQRDGKVYIEKEVFKKIFLNELQEEAAFQELKMSLSFTPPSAIGRLLEISSDRLNRKKVEEKELLFTGKRKFFDLGYTNVRGGLNWNKTPDSGGYDRTWNGSLSYQGGLLYGEFQFDYDVKEDEISGLNLRYDDLIKNHTLEVARTDLTSEGTMSYRFYKEKGYYTDDGNQIVIAERVPVGSRVELIYMGSTIAIQDEENGRVEFSGPQIRSDKEYQMKIYYPDGKIAMKNIVTTEDYNKQSKGEVEYDVSVDEQKGELSGYNTNANLFYGVTDKLTLGFGYQRTLARNYGSFSDTSSTNQEWKKDFSNSATAEVIYGSTYNGYSYTLSFDTEQSLDSYYDGSGDLSDKNKYGGQAELRKDKWTLNYNEDRYGGYNSTEKEQGYSIRYDLPLGIDVEYGETKTYSREGGMDKTRAFSVNADYSYKGFKDILFGASADFDIENSANNTYTLNMYFPQFRGINGKVENSWTNNGKDYEVTMNLYNNNYKGFIDFSTDVSYSNIDKAKIGVTFTMKVDDWLEFDASADREGNRNMSIGIDRIVDLKNPLKKVTNMDISRANIFTFVDSNDNDVFDEGEEAISGVEVTVGNQKVVTDEKGRAKVDELSNGIEYDLNPVIKKPSYTMGRNKVKVLSKFSSEVDVFIPIKPMMNLMGYVELDETLEILPEEKEDFYANIIVQIIDSEGKEVDITAPDNLGFFDMSELYPDVYTMRVYYLGSDYNIKTLNKELKIFNENGSFDFEVNLKVTDEDIEIKD